MNKMNRGLKGLEERVLTKGLCTACGACLSLCPYLRSWQGRVVKLHDCGLEEGRCFSYCPRTEADSERIGLEEVRKKYEKIELGPAKRILMARAINSFWRKRAQSGGVVSALIDLAIRKKVINAAILTLWDTDSPPEGQIVRDREGILNCAGSSYVSGPTLEAIHKGPWKGGERIGVVGLPCQVQALSRMKSSSLEEKTPVDKVELVIGLFCTWALEYEGFRNFLKKRFGLLRVNKLEITPPPERLLKIYTDQALQMIPVDEIRPFIRKGCGVCSDMTAEYSDISAGPVEGMEGWNTMIIRSDQGEKLFKEAEAEGVFESQPLPEDYLDHLKEASLLKKERALRAIQERETTRG
jgi:coenzyme F420 hydrogenase subunit beta